MVTNSGIITHTNNGSSIKLTKIIVLEGLDCSFKETNSKRLLEYLTEKGFSAKLFSFPNYESESSYFVKEYLRGSYQTDPKDVNPKLASLFYSLDRYDTWKKEIEKYFLEVDYIILDRYVGSNAIYQCAKMKSSFEKMDYMKELFTLEHEIMGLPGATQTFFLNVPYEVSVELMKKKNAEDIHEKNSEYQRAVYTNAEFVAAVLDWTHIECTKDGELLSKDEIFNKIIEKLK